MCRKRGRVQLTGSSLLAQLPPAARTEEKEKVSLCRSVAAEQSRAQAVFGSQVLHEATMYYPMRSVRTSRYSTVQYSTVQYSTVQYSPHKQVHPHTQPQLLGALPHRPGRLPLAHLSGAAAEQTKYFFVDKIFLNMTKYFSVQDILNRTRHGAALPWRISLKQYYYR